MKIKLQDYSLISNEWIDEQLKMLEPYIDKSKEMMHTYNALCFVKKNIKPLEKLAEACFDKGFSITGEGWNAEYPFQGPTHTQEEMYNTDKHNFLTSEIEIP